MIPVFTEITRTPPPLAPIDHWRPPPDKASFHLRRSFPTTSDEMLASTGGAEIDMTWLIHNVFITALLIVLSGRLPDVARHPLLEKIAIILITIPLLTVIGGGALGRMDVVLFVDGGMILFRGTPTPAWRHATLRGGSELPAWQTARRMNTPAPVADGSR